MYSMRLSIVLSALFSFLPLAMATAAGQYHLSLDTDTSVCFMTCHEEVCNTITRPDGGYNSATFISINCANPIWADYMAACLVQQCSSPADVAYGQEWGQRFCKKGGVDVTITLPQVYMDSINGTYFQSDGYLASGALSSPRLSLSALAVGVGAVAAILV